MSKIFHLLRALRLAEKEAGIGELDLRGRELLRLIGEEEAQGTAPMVTGLVSLSGLGTAPTVFSALKDLESKGWIERVVDEQDGRARRIMLSQRARTAFARVARKLGAELRN